MDDYMTWREKDQSWLLAAVLKAKRAIGRKWNKETILDVGDISQSHSELIPELNDIFSSRTSLREPLDVWIQDKRHQVMFSSPVGIPRFMALRWVGGTRTRDNEFVEARNRLAVAVTGGLSLIIPMIIMTLHKSLATSLGTVCVAVLLFAFVLAAWPVAYRHLPWVQRRKRLEGYNISNTFAAKEVLLITAAYAAVLVVFVGTSAP
jgi:hypothetical protein